MLLPLSFIIHLLPVVLNVMPAPRSPLLLPLFLDLLRSLLAAVAPVLFSLVSETYLVASAIVTERLRLEFRLPTTAAAGITVLFSWVRGLILVT